MSKMRSLGAGVVVAGVLTVPFLANALTAGDLQAQIKSLIAQIGLLQQQMAALAAPAAATSSPTTSAPPAAICPSLVRALSRGSQGDDVTMLQNFFVTQHLLSADSATGYFGALTEAAVEQWQSDHALVSSGAASSTGWGMVGARTRAAIYAACGGTMPTSDILSVSSRGLFVSADVTANSRGSCAAQQYVLDFGDGSVPHTTSVAANTCHAVHETVSYTYATGGAYTITLTSGAEKISVPLTIAGSASQTNAPTCSMPSFLTNPIPTAAIGSNWSFPILSASTTGDATGVVASGLPPGVTLQDQIATSVSAGTAMHNWILAGTPNASGTYTLTLTAKNSCGTTTRTISLPVSVTNVTSGYQCSSVVVPSCYGRLTWLGSDINGCSLGYQCSAVVTDPVNCPLYQLPLCTNGTLIAQGTDSNGCQLAPQCVQTSACTLQALGCPTGQHVQVNGCAQSCVPDSSSTFSASPTSGTAPLAVTFTVGNTSLTGIDFGDGQQLSAPLFNTCAPGSPSTCNQWSPTHTYVSSGTYVAKLINGYSNGQPQIVGTATITVSSSGQYLCGAGLVNVWQSTPCSATQQTSL